MTSPGVRVQGDSHALNKEGASQMFSTMTIEAKYTKNWIAEWDVIRSERANSDLKTADLARRVRNHMPDGIEGDRMFMQYVKRRFKGCRSDVMLRMAGSWTVFQERDWRRFSGWKGIHLLLALTDAQRRKLLPLMPGDGPYTAKAIRVNARKIGVEIPSLGIGRPTTYERDESLTLVRGWMQELYRRHPDLEPMPPRVSAAFPKKDRAKASIGARA